METTRSLLTEWGFSSLINTFEENEISIEDLQDLDDIYLTELIPKIGIRIKLKNKIKNYFVKQEHDRDTMGLVANEGNKLPQYIAALAATLGAVATGAVLGFTSPTEVDYEKKAIIGGQNVTVDEFKWVGSLSPLGCLVMCIPAGFILDLIGRKITMLVMVIVFTIGWALIIWADSVAMLMVGRFITGMAGGTFCIAAPLYTTETSQKEIRGTVGSYFQLLVTFGILFVYVIGDFAGAQLVAIICGIIPFVFGIAFVFMPESPIYALKKGDESRARKDLQWLRGKQYNIDDEIREMKDALDQDKNNPVSIRDSLKKKATRKGLMISFGLMLFQQLSGINAVIFYTSNIFQSAGLDESTLPAKEAAIIVGAVQFGATFIASLIIDRLGRRILLLISASVMAICLMLLGLFFRLQDHHLISKEEIEKISFLPILSLSVFISVFSLGFGPIPWMISSEVLPREIKTVASSIAGAFNWFLAFLVTLFYADMNRSIGGDVTFFIFMAVCVLGAIFVFILVPETKGKTLEQIQRELGGESPPRSNGVANEGFAP